MLDLHALTLTPGAATTLGNAAAAVATNDKQTVAGVPNYPDATLIAWGGSSIVADTIAAIQLKSLDMIDQNNGETIALGTASLKNLFHKYTNLPYKSGGRLLKMGTNTGTTGGLAYTLDWVNDQKVKSIGGKMLRFAKKAICIPQTLNQDVANTWTDTAFAPTNAIPVGTYALLGAYLSLSTGGHGIRFYHTDFGHYFPGFLSVDNMASAILGWQEGMQDSMSNHPGFQFVQMSELTGFPCVPVFKVTNASNGLIIQSIAAANTDTPVITLNLAQIPSV